MIVQEWRLADGRYLQVKANKLVTDPETMWNGTIYDAQIINRSFMEDAFKTVSQEK